MSIEARELRAEILRDYGADVHFTKIKEALGVTGRVIGSTPIDRSDAVKVVTKHLNLKKPKGSRKVKPDAQTTMPAQPSAQTDSGVGMRAWQMAQQISVRTRPFTISVKEVGQAIGRPGLKAQETVTQSLDDVLAGLLNLKPAMKSALDGLPVNDEDDLVAGELVVYEANPFDEQLRLQVQGMIDHYKSVVEHLGDEPYRPKVTASKSGTGYNFPNPFVTEEDYLSQERYRVLRDDQKLSFPMDTKPLKKAMAALVSQMSSVSHNCFDCFDEIFDDEAAVGDKKMALLLAERFFLPGTPDIPREKIISFTGYCGVCKDIRRAVVKMEVELQEMTGSRAQARRSAFYVDIAVSIYERHHERRPYLTQLLVGQRLKTVAEGRQSNGV